jgi:hypothetical protein
MTDARFGWPHSAGPMPGPAPEHLGGVRGKSPADPERLGRLVTTAEGIAAASMTTPTWDRRDAVPAGETDRG